MSSVFNWLIFGLLVLQLTSSAWASSFPQTQPEVLGIYLKDGANIVRYPKFGYTYNCVAEVIPPDNQSVTSVKMTFNGNPYVATVATDQQAWSAGASETFVAGSVSCIVDVSTTLGLITSRTATWEVTTALPTCTDTDSCTITTAQTVVSGKTYVYENLTLGGAGSLQHLTLLGEGSDTITLKAVNQMNILGTIQFSGENGTAGTCRAVGTDRLSLYANTLYLNGSIVATAGNGYDNSAGACGSSPDGGDVRIIRFYATDMFMSGSITEKSGDGGSGPFGASGSHGSPGIVDEIIFTTYVMNFTGAITQTGGHGSDYADAATSCTTGGGTATGGGYVYGLELDDGSYNFINGTVTLTGGRGGDGPPTKGVSTGSDCGATGGRVQSYSSTNAIFFNNATWNMTGGMGGKGCPMTFPLGTGRAGDGGNAQGTTFTHHNLTKVVNTIALTGGLGGLNPTITTCGAYSYPTREASGSTTPYTIYYAYADPLNDFTKYSPAPTTSASATPQAGPTGVLTFLTPTTAMPIPPLYSLNVTWSRTNASYYAVVDWSLDNSTWSPLYYFPGPSPYGYVSGSASNPWADTGHNIAQGEFLLNRLTSTVYLRGRQSNSNMFSAWTYHSLNVTLPPLIVTNISRVPPDANPSVPTITFYCQANNTYTNQPVQNAQIIFNIGGVNHTATYDAATNSYKYIQTVPPGAGTTTWYCIVAKVNFLSNTSTNGTFTYGNYYLSYPPGVTSVRFLCPFPVYYGITPWGQTAGRGVVRVVNLNQSTLNNYSVSVSAVAPNVSMYYKNNWTNVYNISIGHGDGHILNTTASQFIGNWNGSSVDLWFYADCLNATAGTTMNFSTYIDRVPS